ncbi:MAG TPA: NADH-quinone oxidoreductase subunit C [Ktedonobacterales bacterium]
MAQENQQPASIHPAVAFVRDRFPSEVIESSEIRGEATLVVKPESIVPVCLALRDEPSLRMDMLSSITAVDWPERLPRFDVVYHLLSLPTGHNVRLKVRVGDDETPHPEVPSAILVWPAANWFEREVWDLFGITFTGHPNMRRIELPDDWVGHPLRKDYPLTGFSLPEPQWGGQVPAPAPGEPKTGRRPLRVIRPDSTRK